jgi:hypothetical protein
VKLNFEPSAIRAIAEQAFEPNEHQENIGARRLHTVLELLLSDIAFNAGGGDAPEVEGKIDADYVAHQLHVEEKKKELMDQNEMEGLMFKMTDDPRITKVGKFIRKTSIDELPQFINVLKGEMSMVGTRPPTVEEFKLYEGHHKRRLSMKPGITGMWQAYGRNEVLDFEEIVRMDLDYIDHWNLGLDIKILLQAILGVFKTTGK